MIARAAALFGATLLAICACDTAPAKRLTDARAVTATPGASSHSAAGAAAAESYGFLLRTDAGDTIAIEHVQSADRWLDIDLWLPRRNERQRIVVQRDASPTRQQEPSHAGAGATQRATVPDAQRTPPALDRWDITRAHEHWRVFATGDSLFVTNGDMIGVPVQMHSVAAPRGTRAWHDASPALLEHLVRIWHAGARATMRANVVALPWSEHIRDVTLTARGADSVVARTANGEWRLALRADGHVIGGVSPGRRLRLVRFAWQPDISSARPAESSTANDTASSARKLAYLAEEITITARDGVTLAGTFTRPHAAPDASLRAPAVLLVSGAGPQDRNLSVPALPDYRLFEALADTLTRRGYAVLRLDDRGAGRSGGVAYSATPADEVDDARVAIDWLRARSDVRADRIAIVGHSDGGLTALDAAEGNRVSALVLLGAPARSGRELARAQRRRYVTNRANEFSPAAHEQLLSRLERDAERIARVDPWLRAWMAHDPSTRRWTHGAPALLVHGLRDQQVDPVHARELARLLRGESSRIVAVHMEPDANHLLVADTIGDPRAYAALRSHEPVARVLAVIAEWLDTHVHNTSGAP